MGFLPAHAILWTNSTRFAVAVSVTPVTIQELNDHSNQAKGQRGKGRSGLFPVSPLPRFPFFPISGFGFVLSDSEHLLSVFNKLLALFCVKNEPSDCSRASRSSSASGGSPCGWAARAASSSCVCQHRCESHESGGRERAATALGAQALLAACLRLYQLYNRQFVEITPISATPAWERTLRQARKQSASLSPWEPHARGCASARPDEAAVGSPARSSVLSSSA